MTFTSYFGVHQGDRVLTHPHIIQYQCHWVAPRYEAVELLASAGWLPRQARHAKSAAPAGRWCQTLQVEYAEAVSSLYTSKEGRFLDVLLGKSKGGK